LPDDHDVPTDPPTLPIAIIREELLIWGLGFEALVVFDLKGRELFRRQGQFDEVQITQQDGKALQHAIAIHNHLLDRSFSIRDVNMACTYDITILRAISPSFVYTLTAPQDGWDELMCRGKLFPRGATTELEVDAELRAAVAAGEITGEGASQELKHRIWTRLAPSFGFGYWRAPLLTG
jgi:hypothetical protein